MILRDGKTITEDPRCGLIPQEDTRAEHLFAAAPPDGGIDLSLRELISKRRVKKFGDPLLNQEQWSACAGMTMAAALEHEPGIRTMGSEWAINFYFDAQDHDSFPGSERPGDPIQGYGTSMVAICEEAKRQGLIKNWYRAHTIEEVIIGLGYYSCPLFGFEWTDGMMYPNHKGLSVPTGKTVGGHAHLGTFVNLRDGLLGGPNSWDGWNPAQNGFWVMKISDVENRLHHGGECVFLEKV